MLNDYLEILMGSGVIQTHPGLEQMLLTFLEQGDYDRGGNITRTVIIFNGTILVNPIVESLSVLIE